MFLKLPFIATFIFIHSLTVFAWNTPMLTSPANGAQVWTGVTFDWYAVYQSQQYQFQLDTTPGFNSPKLVSVIKNYINSSSENNDTRQYMEDLFFAEVYYWRVRAWVTGDTSVWSSVRSVLTLNYVPLYSPSSGSEIWASGTLDWGTHEGVNFYDLEVDTSNLFNSTVLRQFSKAYVNTSSGNYDTEQYIEDLYFNQIYYWRVRARNTADTSSWSAVWNFHTRNYVTLNTPSNGTETYVGLTLDWYSHPGIDIYDLQVDTTMQFNSPMIRQYSKAYINSNSSNTDTEQWVEDIFFNQNYYWRVRVRNMADTSVWSEVRWFHTKNFVSLGSPANGSDTWNGVTIDWLSHPGVDYYDMQLDTSNSFNSPVLRSFSKSYVNSNSGNYDTEQYNEDLFFGYYYYWRVRVRNAVDTTTWSPFWKFRTRDYVTLDYPADGQLNVSITGITLDWQAHPGIDVYRLQIDTTNLFNTTSFQQYDKTYINSNSSNSDTRHSTGVLKPNTVYFWKVSAINLMDASTWVVRAFSTGNTPVIYPSIPQLQSPANLAEYLPRNIDFNWSDAADAFAYLIELDTMPDFTSPISYTTTFSQYSISGLANNKSWYWRVRSVRNFIYSAWSPVWTFTTGLENPSPILPANFMTDTPLSNLMCQWSIPNRAENFVFQISKSEDFSTTVLIINQSQNTYNLNDLDPDSRYFWRVKASDGIVESYWSPVWTFFTEPFHLGFLMEIKVLLEGPYSSGVMGTGLNSQGFIPLQQPFSCYPWNMNESWTVGQIPSPDIVDWILIEIRDADSAPTAGSNTILARQPAFVKSDGSVVALNGVSKPQFNVTVTKNLFCVIYHRNHLSVMSSGSLVNTDNSYTWDFSSDVSKVYGGAVAHKSISLGVWGMISGDGNSDGIISNTDKNNIWKIQTGFSGYYTGDFNMNGQVENTDKNNHWKPNTGRGSQVPM